jgi:beta-mannanase
MIDWSPWDLANQGRPNQARFQLRDVIAGRHDDYIRAWAAGAAAWGKPFFVRLCHEMNGSWYPWSERANGNRRGEFVRAWRHVVDLVRASGATNVTWVWAPNEFESYDGIPIRRLYPGDAYADWLGISGFNWGDGQRGSLWRSFDKTFSRSYPRVRAISRRKPIMLAEIGSSERGGSKAGWLRDAFAVRIPRMPSVRAVVYWNRADEGMDWPIETSRSARAAFRRAIALPHYAADDFAQLTASPIPPP